jgi:hypothetical protein
MTERVLILDFGFQYTHLVGRKNVACRQSRNGGAGFFCSTVLTGASRPMST